MLRDLLWLLIFTDGACLAILWIMGVRVMFLRLALYGIVYDALPSVCGLATDLSSTLRERRDCSTPADQIEFVHAQFALVRIFVHIRLLFKGHDLVAG